MVTGLKNVMVDFSRCDWMVDLDTEDSDVVFTVVQPKDSLLNREDNDVNAMAETVDDKKAMRDVLAIGYQIGGYALFGFDYEARITNIIGIHLGFGAVGYTGGLKFHFTPSKNSEFINLNYKDGGLGIINVGVLEYGRRHQFSGKSRFALHYQIGFAKIIHIDDYFERELFGDKKASSFIVSGGIGFSW